MKTKALILLFPFAILFAEIASFPPRAKGICPGASCTKMISKKLRSQQKDDCPKPEGTHNRSTVCTMCPVCSIFVPASHYSMPLDHNFPNSIYSLFNGGNISSYVGEIWKPPKYPFLSA